jgi:hypothetical protein
VGGGNIASVSFASEVTLDDTSEVWDIIPMMEFLIENTTDPRSWTARHPPRLPRPPPAWSPF